MKIQHYLSLLIFCRVFSQDLADLLDENIEKSSHLHIRQKRVINLDKNGDDAGRQIWIENAPYVVNIQKNHTSRCAGTILSALFVLAPESCVTRSFWSGFRSYTILSRSNSRNSGYPHSITRRILVEPSPTIVLLEASPHFDFHRSLNRPISLFLGVVPHTAYGIFSGWGCTKPGNLLHKAVYPEKLMQARLYIIPLAECRRIYHRRFFISNRDICTLDETKRRGTCMGDLGGPLVVRFPPLMAPQLVGVMSEVSGETFGEDPDIFINLNHHDINEWITHTINNQALR